VVAAVTSTGSSSTQTQRRGILIALSGVIVLAVVLRLIGLRFGLPAVYNPDEVAITSRALAFAKGDLNPHNFLYPTFYFYVLFGWLGLSFVVSWITGAVASLSAFQTQFFVDPTNIYVAGRLLGVACGTATVACTYFLGKQFGGATAGHTAGHTAGLMAALFLAVTPGHVRDSHYVKHDVPATLAIVLAQLAILRAMNARDESDPTRDSGGGASKFIIAGAACGVACSTHYYAVFLSLPLLIAIATTRQPLKRVLQAGVAAALAFFALSPFLLVEPMTAWRDIVANRQIVVDRAVSTQHTLFGNLPAYLRMLWSDAGWPVCLGSLAGAMLLVRDALRPPDGASDRRRDRVRLALVVLTFPIAFLLFISNTVAASRYLNPMFPTCAALAAYAVVRLVKGRIVRIALSPQPQPASVSGLPPARHAISISGRGPSFPWLVALLMSLPGLVFSLRLDLFFRQADTRTIAQQFIEKTVPPGATVLIQPYSVPLTQSRDSLIEALRAHGIDPQHAPTKFALRLALNPEPSPAYRTLYLGEGGLDQDKIYLGYQDVGPALDSAGVQYVVLKRYNASDPAVEPLLAQLTRDGRLLTAISPYGAEADAATRARVAPFLHNTDTPYDPALDRPGPGIEVWQLKSR
jgi:hypothetical protein